jgi:hypothetical protein
MASGGTEVPRFAAFAPRAAKAPTAAWVSPSDPRLEANDGLVPLRLV